jgi:hypothetical protein
MSIPSRGDGLYPILEEIMGPRSLGLYEAEYEGVGDTDNREPVAIEGELRTQFDEYDLFALANAENWWSLVLEQIGQGLL